MSDKINIILDGEHISANSKDSILKVAKDNGIDIPTLCNDPRLEPYSSCYVCVVEIENMKGLQPSCSTKVTEGMNIITNNKKVRKSRKTALDLIMSNHYADCIAPCTESCPAGVDVQGYISLIEKKLYKEAVALIKEVNPLPAICGRVCVRPCELACNRNSMDESAAVGIDYMKRYASDFDLAAGDDRYIPEIAKSTEKKIAIIGAGPGGLSSAYFLQQLGHQCDIYEAAPEAGGWLRYGIPEYRLPNDLLDKEVNSVLELGANIFYNKKLGTDISYKELQANYDSVILTIGSQKGTLVGVKGDDAENVFPGIVFLKNLEMTENAPDFTGKKVIVVGGGNTAMDCCRTAIRLGSTDVKVVYRRTEKEMPANPIEIHESKLEGVEYLFLNNPIEVNKDDKGVLKSVSLIRMELGEPDSSGRRRPIPIEGSEYDLEVDFIFAAIGQKTDIDFIESVNSVAKDGELQANRWGDIDANPKTLQTGVKSIFAAGDGVTGAATIIEAIAQAKIASNSCHQFVMGEEVIAKRKEFISLRSNFINDNNNKFIEIFPHQQREEMPVLDESKRINFNEVELGYSEEQCLTEASRCMECGCGEYFDCDLQKYSDEYNVEQSKYAGEYNEYIVDFSHPYIEIDNNKCILCSRCIRICDEVVGANALGLVNRGFTSFVAPSMTDSLTETNCQTCGLCIDTCPTGAIRENLIFKPGPVATEPLYAIDIYGSEGVAMNLLSHKRKFVMGVEGTVGLINPQTTIGRKPKFGYQFYNDTSRITTPLLKRNGKFEEISFGEALSLVYDKIKATEAMQNIFFAGARMTNEEIYLIQKFAKEGVGTPYVASFSYLGRGSQMYSNNAVANVPFEDLIKTSKIFIFGADLINENDFTGFLVNEARTKNNCSVNFISETKNEKMSHKVDTELFIDSYYYFIKALNFYFIKKNLLNRMFIDSRTEGFEEYKQDILKPNLDSLLEKAGVTYEQMITVAKEFNNDQNAVIIFSEKYINAETSIELYNLAMITGKLGKKASGILSLKEKNNSQGIFDMGAMPCIDTGSIYKGYKPDKKIIPSMKKGDYKNIFIFGEDPIGTAKDINEVTSWFGKQDFLVVQDYFITETAKEADLILPASFAIESDGSFTNTQRVIQQFEKQIDSPIKFNNFEQLSILNDKFKLTAHSSVNDVFMEIGEKLPLRRLDKKFSFKITNKEQTKSYFNHGADYIVKRFDEEFEQRFK